MTRSLSVPELVEVVEKYYELVGPRHLLWDFTQADLSRINDENFADIAAVAARRLGRKEGRKTAYTAAEPASARG